METMLETSSGTPSRCTGTLAAIPRPGSCSLSKSISVPFVQVLSKLVGLHQVREKSSELSYRECGVGIMPVDPIMAGETLGVLASSSARQRTCLQTHHIDSDSLWRKNSS